MQERNICSGYVQNFLMVARPVSRVIVTFIGAAVAAVRGILIGIPVLRLRGDYLAIVTLVAAAE